MFKKKEEKSEVIKAVNECKNSLKENDKEAYYEFRKVSIFLKILEIPIWIVFIMILPFLVIRDKIIKKDKII